MWGPLLEATSPRRPASPSSFDEKGEEPETLKKTMNTNENTTPNNTAAPSVTIAPRNPAKGVLLFVVTLTTHQTVRSYPCGTFEKAAALAARFITSITKAAR